MPTKLTDSCLHNCMLPGKIDGSYINLAEVESPIVGIAGLGSMHERKGKRSVWINGELLTANFIRGDNCPSKSHIEGIVMDNGQVRLLESPYDFPVHEGDCIEYNLHAEWRSNPKIHISFEGETFSRLGRNNYKVEKMGQVYLALNPHWEVRREGTSVVPSLPYNNRHHVSGTYIPQFWKSFLEELEKKGYDHPYEAISDKLKKEREVARTAERSVVDVSDIQVAEQLLKGEVDAEHSPF